MSKKIISRAYTMSFHELLILNDGPQKIYQRKKENKPTILIVDDEEIIVEMYRTKFETEGYNVLTASNGEEGLIIAKQEKPDIILTDIVMPRYNGFHLLKKLKSNPEISDIPVIIISNLNDDERRQRACELGALYFLVKSECLPGHMAEIIDEILKIKRKYNKVLTGKKEILA